MSLLRFLRSESHEPELRGLACVDACAVVDSMAADVRLALVYLIGQELQCAAQ